MRFVSVLRAMLVLAVVGLIAQAFYAFTRARPQDMPWTALDLRQPIGLFTGRKLTALGDAEPGHCRALLAAAGARVTALPPRRDGARCGYDDAVRVATGVTLAAPAPGVACPVAAALFVWEREVVRPEALRMFGAELRRIDHFGSYSCRRLYGRDSGAWSEHAAADAIDIAGFRLADGRRITVARDWRPGESEESRRRAAFLHAVRDGACPLFATTLSPDYNAAHHDHLHLDQAIRGAMGWRACR
ncbi:extensin-like domain-containing protein [Sphingomonas quercus]|uniref:Extensin family protein n=1 Tax=Sphingomonas quercus TaxID=2842451 RepID=A0ABS6BDA2_9SPHN|nr:extensin family protein [Sphingomonas quercus]MBU3076293.1 extensin family protein [Sphingomonas quercus]